MSEENVERTHRSIEAWNHDDLDAYLAGFHPKGEFHTTGRFVDEGVYRGRSGLERLWTEFHEDFEELSLSASEVRPVGDDKVLVVGAMVGRGKQSGAAFEEPLCYLATFRDHLVIRVEAYVDRAEALEAAGLSE